MKRFLSRFFAKIKKLNKKVIAGFLIGVIAGILLSYIFTSSYVVQLSIRNGIFLTKYNKWTGHVDWTLYNYEGDIVDTSDSKKKKDLGLEKYSDSNKFFKTGKVPPREILGDTKYYKSWSEYSNTDEYRAMSPDEQYNELRNWAFANDHRLKMAEGYTPESSRKLGEFALAKKREIFKDDLKYYKSWSEYSNTDEFKALSPDEQYQELYNWTAVTDRRMKMADGYTPELSRKLKEFALAKKREIYKGKKED